MYIIQINKKPLMVTLFEKYYRRTFSRSEADTMEYSH